MTELNDSIETKHLIERLREQAKSEESSEAIYQLMTTTVIGEIQKEFYVTLEKEVSRCCGFYQELTRNIIMEVNSILKNREQWQ